MRSTNRQSQTSTQDEKSTWWGYFPVVLVAFIGASITFIAFIESMFLAKSQVEIAFKEASQDRILVTRQEIDQSLALVQDIASYFEASEVVDRREFRKFVGPALKRQAGIKALKWIPVVSASDRNSFVEDARRSFPPFQITEISPSGEPVESSEKSKYYPVLYVQPYQKNKELLGLDLGTNPVISSMLVEAELTRSLQVSAGIDLEDDTKIKKGIIVTVPVFFKTDQPEDMPVESITKIRGFAVGIFFIGDIIERALERLRSGGIDMHFYQKRSDVGTDLLYTHLSRSRNEQTPKANNIKINYKEPFLVGNQQWVVETSPIPEKFETETWYSWIIFAGGTAFTILITLYVMTLVGRERKIRQEVNERTAQLQEVIQAMNREVIERKSAEEELQRLNETLEQHIASRTAEAERRAQYLEQFAYVTSHDLKAPLRAVSNLAQWIDEDLSDKLDDASREKLTLLRDRVRRMNNLIEGLLEYSRVGRTIDVEENVNTNELLTEVIDSLAPPKEFKIKIGGEMPTLYADRLQLGQVFSNLISNSLKHHGGDKGKIRVMCEALGNFYQFSVCDDGKGIEPEYHGKVFMMFQTLESSDYKNSTGIGLALVKKIVEEHGGTIRLESDIGEGVCFYFTWPRKQPSEEYNQK